MSHLLSTAGTRAKAAAKATHQVIRDSRNRPKVPVVGKHDVVVIGAGFGGLSALEEVVKKHDAVGFEWRNEPGGRARSIVVNDLVVPLGPSWAHHAKRNPLTPVLAEMGIPLETTHNWGLYIGNRRATIEENAEFQRELDLVDVEIKNGATGRSAETLIDPNWEFADIVEAWVGHSEAACHTSDIDASDAVVFRPEDDLLVLDLAAVAKQMADKLPITYGAQLTEVQARRGLTRFIFTRDSDGEQFSVTSKAGINTLPVGVLASKKIKFDPPLPRKIRKALENLPMGIFNKNVVTFDSNVFGDMPANTCLMAASEDPKNPDDTLLMLLRPGGQNMAIVFTGGEHGRWLETQDEEVTRAFVMKRLKDVVGDHIVGHDTAFVRTTWGQDQYSMGSWSGQAPGHDDAHDTYGERYRGGNFNAGEAASSEECGTIDGAYKTGKTSAAGVDAYLSSPRPYLRRLAFPVTDPVYAARKIGREMRNAYREAKAELFEE